MSEAGTALFMLSVKWTARWLGSMIPEGNGNSYQAVQPSPRVYDGKIYCGSRSGYICALDAVTGNLLWQYAYRSDVAWVESSAAIANGVVICRKL